MVLLRQALEKGTSVSLLSIMVTVHVATDQNIEIEIFAEYKYTLNELPVKFFFSIRQIVCEIWRVYKVLL